MTECWCAMVKAAMAARIWEIPKNIWLGMKRSAICPPMKGVITHPSQKAPKIAPVLTGLMPRCCNVSLMIGIHAPQAAYSQNIMRIRRNRKKNGIGFSSLLYLFYFLETALLYTVA